MYVCVCILRTPKNAFAIRVCHVYLYKYIDMYINRYVYTYVYEYVFSPSSLMQSLNVTATYTISIQTGLLDWRSGANPLLCCSILQYVAVCCSVLQCVAVCCSVLQCVAVCCKCRRMLQCCVAAWCRVLKCVAGVELCFRVLQRVSGRRIDLSAYT